MFHGSLTSLSLQLQFCCSVSYLVDASDIFNFFLLGEGEGGVRGAG